MPITINEPIILTEEQVKKFESLTISRVPSGLLSARVVFAILDNSGNKVKEEVLSYEEADYNTFWVNFNTGKYLYQELVKDSEIELPETMECDFLNEDFEVPEPDPEVEPESEGGENG